MARKLARYVTVGGTTYGPKDDVPPDVAKQITNPKVWADDNPSGTGGSGDGKADKAGTRSGARLAMYVDVGGDTYGPDDAIPDDVAAKIINPSAWVDRKLPPAAERAAREAAGERTAATPPPLPNSGTPAARAGDQPVAGVTLSPEASGAEDDGSGGGSEGNRPVPAKKAAPRKATGSGA